MSKSRYQIIPIDIEQDPSGMFGVWNAVYPGFLETVFQWKYLEYPFGRPAVFLLYSESDREHVGATSVFPRPFLYDGKTWSGGLLADMVVKKEHRTLVPALAFHRFVLQSTLDKGYDFLYGFPNRNSRIIMEKTGCVSLGMVPRYVKAVSPSAQFRSSLRIGSDFPFPVKNVDRAFNLFERTLNRPLASRNLILGSGESEIDRLGEIGDRKEQIIRPLKTGEYLRWKYFSRKPGEYRLYTAVPNSNDSSISYIIVHVEKNSITIRDFDSSVPFKNFIFHNLVKMFFEKEGKDQVQKVAIYGTDEMRLRKMISKQFYFSSTSNMELLVAHGERILKEIPGFMELKNWHIVSGDDDT